jgi:hypothetical protein
VCSLPIEFVLPLFHAEERIGIIDVGTGVEFLQVRLLSSFDFSVQVCRARLNRAELDEVLHQPLLTRYGEELPASTSLDSLDRKRHLVHPVLEKLKRITRTSLPVNSQDLVSGTVVNRSELVDSGGDFHAVHPDSITWNGPRVSTRLLLAAHPLEWFCTRRTKRLVNRCNR